MVFHWSLSECKSPQVSRTFLSILAVLNNVLVWMVSTHLLISWFSSPFINPLVTVPIGTIGIILTFIFHFFQFLSKVPVLILLFTFFQFYSVVNRGSEVQNNVSSLFLLLIIIRSGRLVEIRGSICMSKSKRRLCFSFSRTDTGLYNYHLFVWSNFNFCHNSQWITLPTQSCLVLYSFCANLLHLLFCYVLSILA